MHTIVPPTGYSSLGCESLQQLAEGLKPDHWAVVPCGNMGFLLWNRLPIEVARLLRPPQHFAAVLIPGSASQSPSDLWDRLVAARLDHIQILHDADMSKGEADPSVLPSLAPKRSNGSPAVKELDVGSGPDAIAVHAGLFQFWDELHKSHEQSQSIEGEGLHGAGDYWHAIMHRREPDYGNSKYWFRNVGSHLIFPELAEHAADILSELSIPEAAIWSKRLTGRGWDPMVFVDLCQQVARQESAPLGIAARRIQLVEMILLLESTLVDAA